jgi:plasmid stabilization system protein ParE
MAFKVSFLPEAQQDYDEAIEWYEKQKPGLGFRLYLEIEETMQHVSDNPTHYTFLVDRYRDVALKTFPYRIVFTIQETEVIVFAIFHTSRSEEEIYKRLQ